MTANAFKQECHELSTIVRLHFEENKNFGSGKVAVIGWLSDHLDGVKKKIKKAYMLGQNWTYYTTDYDSTGCDRLSSFAVDHILLLLLPKILDMHLTFELDSFGEDGFVIAIKCDI